jgi:hypothetical protein
MPFTEVPDKWNLQQRLAAAFRERHLSARSNTCDNDTIRLDDLEALALMINFDYDDSAGPPLLSNLGRLFLTHAYWHTYGLDAFHCLDKKQMSRIPNNDVGSSEKLSLHETKDYFNALLALAVIAR